LKKLNGTPKTINLRKSIDNEEEEEEEEK